MLFVLGFLLLMTSAEASYQQGVAAAKASAPGKPTHAGLTPGYAGTNPSQAGLYKSGDLSNAATRAFYKSESGKALLESNNKRQSFTLDPTKDPIFIQADAIVENPLEVVEAEEKPGAQQAKIEISKHTCQEARESVSKRCRLVRKIRIVQPPDEHKELTWVAYGHGGGAWCQRRNIYTGRYSDGINRRKKKWYHALSGALVPHDIRDKIQEIKIKSVTSRRPGLPAVAASLSAAGDLGIVPRGAQRWGKHKKQGIGYSDSTIVIDIRYTPDVVVETYVENDCAPLEVLADRNVCFIEDEISDGPSTKSQEGHEVSAEWWLKERTYRCEYLENPPKSCNALKARGCVQIASKCLREIAGQCVLYEKTFECESKYVSGKRVTLKGAVPYCLDGSCVEQSWAPNQDMAEALSKLLVFKEMQKDMDANAARVFTGSTQKCHRNCVSFLNCCRRFKGWGQSIGLARCSAVEKNLGKLRDQGRCIAVGTYCAKKVLGACVTKKTSFCCYGTKLARIVQQQAHRQLGLGFGSPKHPQCQGLTVEQLQRVDFAKIDLSELFTELKVKPLDPQKLSQEIHTRFKNQQLQSTALNKERTSS